MRLYQQMYFDDTISRPVRLSVGNPVNAGNSANFPTSVVQSNMPAESTPELGVDFVALERQARAARSAWVGSKLKSFYQALVRKFERAGAAEMENYLAASQNLAELEERIRRYERGQPLYY
jgi:hypothetical protein